MNKLSILAFVILSASLGCAEKTTVSAPSPAETNAPPAAKATPAKKTISIQEMLMNGPSNLKLHSLAMITQGNMPGEVDDSYLPAFKVCSDDTALPVRSVTARLLGQHFIQGQANPNPEAIGLLIKLSKDVESDVRYNAVYFGLTQVMNKSDEILERLIDTAAADRKPTLYNRIIESLQNDREKVAAILDRKLKDGSDISVYEIYEDLTGQRPAIIDKYLDMPSSRPRLFIFSGEGPDSEAYKAELAKTLKSEGIENPDVQISGMGENYVLVLKTYLTRDSVTAENLSAKHPEFKITQEIWLTPELEIQIEAMQQK